MHIEDDEKEIALETETQEKVLKRLWSIDEEYERLKSEVPDHKMLLAALKQQTDLLVVISKLGDNREKENTWDLEYDPELAAKELRELFRKVQPLLTN